jgi:hypothetical protein
MRSPPEALGLNFRMYPRRNMLMDGFARSRRGFDFSEAKTAAILPGIMQPSDRRWAIEYNPCAGCVQR